LFGVGAGKEKPLLKALVKELPRTKGLAGISRRNEEENHVGPKSDPPVIPVFDLFEDGIKLGRCRRSLCENSREEWGENKRQKKKKSEYADPPSHQSVEALDSERAFFV
jgi:hypothetical protein